MRQAAVFITSLMALVLVVAPLGAQQQQGTQGVETPKCMVEGQVVKLGTAEPLRKAWVVLRKAQGRSEPYTTTTDDSGRFRLEEVEPGRYRLFAVRNGYVRQEWGQRGSSSAGTPLTLRPGQRVRDLVFKLERAAVIAGRVYDEDGEALLNVRVQALRYRYLRGQRQLRPVSSDQSNDLGEYRLYGLAPGEYFISATYTSPLVSVLRFFGGFGAAAFERRGRGGRRGGGDEGYAPTYYPGTNDAGQASPIEISAGGEIRGIDFMLLPTGTRRIRGTVYNNLSGQLGRNIAVWLLVRNSTVFSFSNRNRAQVQDDGSFELRGVTPGSYTLLANYSDGRKRYTARQAVEVGGSDVEGVQLVIGPGVTVAGTLRVEGTLPGASGRPGTGAAASGSSEDTSLRDVRIVLEPRDAGELFFGQSSGRPQEDGTFVLEGVAVGDYNLRLARLPQDHYLQSARLAGEDVLEEGLNVPGGGLSDRLEIVVSAAGARVEGAVLNDEEQPYGGARVVLVPEARQRHRRELFKSAVSDQNGRFVLRGIAPGEYKLFAWEQVEQGAWQDAEFLRRYEEQGQVIRIDEGATHGAELALIPATGR